MRTPRSAGFEPDRATRRSVHRVRLRKAQLWTPTTTVVAEVAKQRAHEAEIGDVDNCSPLTARPHQGGVAEMREMKGEVRGRQAQPCGHRTCRESIASRGH